MVSSREKVRTGRERRHRGCGAGFAMESHETSKKPGLTGKYEYYHFNTHDALRTNAWFWAVNFFLSRHVFLIFLYSYASGRMKMQKGFGDLVNGSSLIHSVDPSFALANVPTLLLLIAVTFRTPRAGIFWRKIWENGRPLIYSSIAIYFFLYFREIQSFRDLHVFDVVPFVLTVGAFFFVAFSS